jgi:hypothetical protein
MDAVERLNTKAPVAGHVPLRLVARLDRTEDEPEVAVKLSAFNSSVS